MLADRQHARIFLGRVVLAGRLLVPVEDAADEGRDQEHPGVGAGDGLGLAEEQRQVAVDAFLLQHFGGADAFPGGGELDEDAILLDAALLVGRDDGSAPWRARLRCRRKGRRRLRSRRGRERASRARRRPRSPDGRRLRGDTASGLPPCFLPQATASLIVSANIGVPSALRTMRRVGRAIDRLQAGNGLDVAGIGNDRRHLAQLVELGHDVPTFKGREGKRQMLPRHSVPWSRPQSALMMAPKSVALRDAPPTSAPSTSGMAKICAAFAGFTEPP